MNQSQGAQKVVESAPQNRVEGQTTIIPIAEEELHPAPETYRLPIVPKDVTVAREETEIESVDAEGRSVAGRAGEPRYTKA